MKLLIVVIVALVAVFVTAGFFGIIDLPGITPQKKKTNSAAIYTEGAEKGAPPKTGISGAETPSDSGKGSDEPPAEAGGASEGPPPTEKANSNRGAAAKQDPAPKPDPDAGQKKLARVFSKVDAASIARIVASWPIDDLAKQLAAMPPKQAGEVLSLLEPEKASKLCKKLQELGALEAAEAARRAAESGKQSP